jgi:hypothetical protein
MRDPLAAVLQAILSLVIVGLVTPVALATIPPMRDTRVGQIAIVVVLALTFVVIRLLWPGKRRGTRADRT